MRHIIESINSIEICKEYMNTNTETPLNWGDISTQLNLTRCLLKNSSSCHIIYLVLKLSFIYVSN